MLNDNLLLPDPHPTRADAIKNRALLLETAQQLFAVHGVEAVSMSAIAEAANVGKGTLYRHFKNKLELCVALLDDEQRDLQTHTLRRLGLADSACDKLRWFISEVARFVFRNVDLLAVGVGDVDGSSLGHPAHFWWRQTLFGLLSELAKHNPVLSDPAYSADVLYLMLDVRTVRFQRLQLGYSEQRILDGLAHIVDRLTD